MSIKFSVSSENKNMIKVKKISNRQVSNLVDTCLYLKNLFQKYTFNLRKIPIEKIYFDFIPQDKSHFIFLQIKHFQSKPNFSPDEKANETLRIQKGLEGQLNPCIGLICNYNNLSSFINALCLKKIIPSKFSKIGINIDNSFLIEEYNQFFKDINEINNYPFHPLSPLLISKSQINKNSKLIKTKNFSFIKKVHFEIKYTCDLCHKVIQLFKNKMKLDNKNNFISKNISNIKNWE